MHVHETYDYAVIRVVPRVEREEFVNVGVILSCERARFIEARIEVDPVRLRALDPAIDLALVATQLCAMRAIRIPEVESIDPPRDLPTDYTGCFLDAMTVSLSGRIHLDDTAFATPEAILAEIWQDHFLLSPAAAEPG